MSIIMVSSLIYSLCAVSGLLATTVNGLPKKGHRAETSLPIVKQTKCGSHTYQYNGLVGYGTVPSNAVDKYGDTLGGFGSSIAIEQASWKKNSDGTYEGIAWAIPDRGWNTQGTLNVQSRIQKLSLKLTLAPGATVSNPSDPNLEIELLDTLLLTGPDGTPMTGLDADFSGNISYSGFPGMPGATYPGDGFGGSGAGGRRISLDSEGIVIGKDGAFWVSDEYGPYVYKFSREGRMLQAIQPPAAYIPRRNGKVSFSAASAPIYEPDRRTDPEDPETGRNNNQGFEGLAISRDGKTLYALIQSALNNDGGPKKRYRKQARMLEYDISGSTPKYTHEYVVTLATFVDPHEEDPSKATIAASQSEIHYLPTGDFLILSRDSNAGRAAEYTESVYRHADIISKSAQTTDIKSKSNDKADGSIASSEGVLDDGINPLDYCSGRALALVPVDPSKEFEDDGKNEYFLISFSDNDYITQDGHLNFGQFKYADKSGFNVDTQVLVFRVTL
ncbi:hypothetical protein TESG_07879 [Trichophyton tonsurans CBS 112818]|uniref:Phytase-like domain-containing protein n=1 Tax=Trichophyton tonsurans (strain CBS 112818) TaxID=647933 RepID=F2SAH6_TRIT1|nr:hypothetical protein TESG_07879 [Trichophyton tonsurans CBS 112818]